MEINDYQKAAMSTCLPSSNNWEYMFTGLVGEVGELASKMAKAIRRGQLVVSDNQINNNSLDIIDYVDLLEGIKGEIGDCAWFVAGICHMFGWTLEEVCQYNIEKLASRQKRGVIDGYGDKR